MNKNIFLVPIVLLISIFTFNCKEKKTFPIESKQRNEMQFFGDSILKAKNFFESVAEDDGYIILNKYNKNYKKQYFRNFLSKKNMFYNSNSVIVKTLIDQSSHKDDLKLNFYTFSGNKKIDSIPFYRNIDTSGRGEYSCLSYFDQKTNKLWQIRYFHLKGSKSVDIVLYEESKVLPNGKIKSDSIRYLDELLDLEVEKLNLYY